MRAACFRDTSVLPEIDRWVAELRDRGRVPPDTYLSVQSRGNTLIGLLHDRAGSRELSPGSFLVFAPGGLEILDEAAFFRRYQDPGLGGRPTNCPDG